MLEHGCAGFLCHRAGLDCHHADCRGFGGPAIFADQIRASGPYSAVAFRDVADGIGLGRGSDGKCMVRFPRTAVTGDIRIDYQFALPFAGGRGAATDQTETGLT